MFTVLFTFPSRYLFTIGLPGVFSLSGWCRTIQPGFLLSRPTQDTRRCPHASPKGLSPAPAGLPRRVRVTFIHFMQVLLPRTCRNMHGLGCSAFARHYSRNHSCFLLLRLLRCFSSAGLPPLPDTLLVQGGLPHSDIRGSAPLAGPRGFSQLVTSFFASGSLGIPRTPLFTYS